MNYALCDVSMIGLGAWSKRVSIAILWAGTAVAQPASTPSLVVDPPTGIRASGPPGGPFSPPGFQYRVRSSVGTVKYSISTPSWLSASPTVGRTDASGVTITFTVNEAAASRLVPGNYGPAVAFANVTNGRGTTVRRSVLVIQTSTSPPHRSAPSASAPPVSAPHVS